MTIDLDASLPQLLDERYSCRAFLSKPVPRADIESMLQLAQRTPSWCNTQPWKVVVTSSEATERLRTAVVEQARAGNWGSDIPAPTAYHGVYADRRRDAGYALYTSLGIERHDKSRRNAQLLENYRFFGAPHVAVITTERALGTYGAVDCGGYVATLLLAAQSLGIAAVPQAAIAMVASAVRHELSIEDDRDILCAIAFGHADESHPANSCRTDRAGLDLVAQFVEV